MHGKQALAIIQRCVREDRYTLHDHFVQRMDERGLFLPDVLAIVNQPSRVLMDGHDVFGRPRCLLSGRLTDGTDAQLLAVVEESESGHFTVFITVYWD